MLLVCGPQGYYDRGVYVSTHITECVTFCMDRGRVNRMVHRGTSKLILCECWDGSTKILPLDPYSPLLE